MSDTPVRLRWILLVTMLIKAFGFLAIAEEDGTGYRRYEDGAP